MICYLQAITSPDNAPATVRNRVYDYLRLYFISTCVSYILNILPVIRISSLLACYNSNMIDEIIIVTQ